MASIFRQTITYYVDDSGKRVPKSAPEARLIRKRSHKWYGQYRDANGIERRVSLATDKLAAQAMLTELVRKSERRMAGLADPFEDSLKRPLTAHLADYEVSLRAKGGCTRHVQQSMTRIRRLMDGCKFVRLTDLDATKVAAWLALQRKTAKRFSAQTSNFYLDAMKSFCNWLVTHERLPRNPFHVLKRVNVDADRRHDRRPLSDEEFSLLIAAAEAGPIVEGLSGIDRAMLYVLAAWTGYRRRELGSLTLASCDLDSDTPTIRVSAAYSKRRRNDAIPLHPYVVDRFRKWLANRPPGEFGQVLFQLQTPKGFDRKTAKMMMADLAAARSRWINQAESEKERARRESSNFLRYKDEQGRFADFHANRHAFITRLSQAGVPLVVAQKLARHSDPRLTANRYTHLELSQGAAAIGSLIPPTEASPTVVSTGSPDRCFDPTSESLLTTPLTRLSDAESPSVASGVIGGDQDKKRPARRKSRNDKTLGNACRQESLVVAVHPRGLEPLTFGSVDRCSIQLS